MIYRDLYHEIVVDGAVPCATCEERGYPHVDCRVCRGAGYLTGVEAEAPPHAA